MPERASKRRASEVTDESPTEPRKKAVRRRAPLACEECRARKRRCDGATPVCGGCMKRMSSCVYLAEVQERAWNDSVIESLRNRLQELEEAEAARSTPTALPNPSDSRTTTNSGRVPLDEGTRANNPQTPHPPLNNQSMDAELRAAPTFECADTSTALNTSPYGSCSVERLMRPIDEAIHKKIVLADSTVHSQPDERPIGTRLISKECSCRRLLCASTWSLPLRSHADDLVRLYFSRVHRICPILNQSTFMKQYEQLWESSDLSICSGLCKQRSGGKTFPAMVNAVFAMASLFESSFPEQSSARAGAFFTLTQKLDLLDIMEEEVGIDLVQLLLLMGFYLQSTEKFSKCWNITGLAIRMAQNMGLHLSVHEAQRKGLLAAATTQLETEMRARVWYGCVLLDREISMSFGRPLMISGGAECVHLPEAIDDHHLSTEEGKWNSQPNDTPSLVEGYIRAINLYGILGQVLDREESRNSTYTHSSSDMNVDTQSLLNMDTSIMAWKDSLPPHLHYDTQGERTSHNYQRITASTSTNFDGFLGQATRLHTRFLHVRVLILRPALDHLFQAQRHSRPSTPARPSVARVQDLLLSNIAAQCVVTADSLVRFLDAQIRSQSLVAWWYNISYLHSCGSTLLMGLLCTFNESTVQRESLVESWELCLQCISRYTSLSSIARKSFHLLQESARRLLPEKDMRKDHELFLTAQGFGSQQTTIIEESNLAPMAPTLEHSENCATEDGITTQGLVPDYQQQTLESDTLQVLGERDAEGFVIPDWGTDPSGTSYWSFMPYLSQLEALPDDFGVTFMNNNFGG